MASSDITLILCFVKIGQLLKGRKQTAYDIINLLFSVRSNVECDGDYELGRMLKEVIVASFNVFTQSLL